MSITCLSDEARDRLIESLRERWEIGVDRVQTSHGIQGLFPAFDGVPQGSFAEDAEAEMLRQFWKSWISILPNHKDVGVRVEISKEGRARLASCAFLRMDLEPLSVVFVRDGVDLDIDEAWPLFKLTIDKMPHEITWEQEQRMKRRLRLIETEVVRRGELIADYEYLVAPIDQGDQAYVLYELLSQAEMELMYIRELLAMYQGQRGKRGEAYKGPPLPKS